MKEAKKTILEKIGYTILVYGRINKKLKTNLSQNEIEELIYKTIEETEISQFSKRGKNFYVMNRASGVRVTINSNSYRVITVDKIVG